MTGDVMAVPPPKVLTADPAVYSCGPTQQELRGFVIVVDRHEPLGERNTTPISRGTQR
jgi:hypothetical protein